MKFFRQRSSSERRFSFSSYGFSHKTADPIDEILKKLRLALDRSETVANEPNKKINVSKQEPKTTSASVERKPTDSPSHNRHSEVDNETTIRQYLENLKQRIIANKVYLDNYYVTEVSEVSEEHKNNSNEIKSNANDQQNNQSNDIKSLFAFTDELFSSDIILELIVKLPLIGFENKKLIATIICNALLLRIDDRLVTVDYVCREQETLFALIDSYKYGRSDLTLNCGRILRQCLKHKCLARNVLYSKKFYELFAYVEQKRFDVAMDAFITLRSLLTTHRDLIEEYLTENEAIFFDNYMKLIDSDNYVTKRQSLEILALVMKDSELIRQMFARQTTRLTAILDLMRHKYRHIRFRALNVFNVLISSDKDSDLSMTIVRFLAFSTDRQQLVEVLHNFRDYKTKCKMFLELKPFAVKLIDFLDETTKIGE